MDIVIPSLPLPLIGALILCWLGLNALMSRNTSPWFLALIAACAWQSLLIALAMHYGLTPLRLLQPVTAVLVPPLAFMSLLTAGLRHARISDLRHAAAPLLVLAAVVFWRPAIDPLVTLTFLGYGITMLWFLRTGADTLPRARLQSGSTPIYVWRLIAVGLILSALTELVIIAAFATGHPALIGWVIGVYSSGVLLTIGALSLSRDLSPPPQAPKSAKDVDDGPAADPDQSRSDQVLVTQLQELLETTNLQRDPDLTLTRLARRLGVPVKTLSAAINRHTGENVSRFVNRARVTEACDLLSSGMSVTQAMLTSGFNTKSNFNREFKRITGTTPSNWVQQNPSA